MDEDEKHADRVNRAVDSLDFPDAVSDATGPVPTSRRAPHPRRSILGNLFVLLVTLIGSVLLGHSRGVQPPPPAHSHLFARRRAIQTRR